MVALEPGTRLPPIKLRDARGRPARLPSGETLYGFFKTTCPTSALAWRYLDRIHKLGDGGRLRVLAVAQDDAETTARFYRELDVAIPTLYDPEPWRASETLGVTSVPTFLLVDAGGAVRDSAVGFQKHKMEEFGQRAAREAGRPAEALFLPEEDVPAIKPG